MDGTKEQFKWFGEGFDGFPKSQEDTLVFYRIFDLSKELENTQFESRLEKIKADILDLSAKYLDNHIWNDNGIALDISNDSCQIPHLRGQTNSGDTVEDEWLITFLLLEISKSHSNLWIQVRDTDGEFLMIEAANSLPSWMNPEIADNRVWIHRGKLLLLPLSRASSSSPPQKESQSQLALTKALSILQNDSQILINNKEVENEAFYRLKRYPAQIPDLLHYSIISIPRNLALVLHLHPEVISSAIRAVLEYVPPKSKQSSQEKSKSEPFKSTDLVLTSVKFTKVGFAQIKSHTIRTPHSWSNILASPSLSDAEHERLEVSMKLVFGFNLLAQDPSLKGKPGVEGIKSILDRYQQNPELLPSDSEVNSWPQRDDDESWLDIDFGEFEKELAGTRNRSGVANDASSAGFGHKAAEENLRKMVSRFEDFLNDDNAGIDGAEFKDDMDYDDEESEDEGDSDGEDKNGSFDEAKFARMMREMMGMPGIDDPVEGSPKVSRGEPAGLESLEEEDDIDAEEMRTMMRQMEAELNEAGALNLDPTRQKIKATSKAAGGKRKDASDAVHDRQEETDSEEEEDDDVTLVKNMLESFKSQGGLPGPGGNLMGLMGIQMPRDSDNNQPP